MDDDSRNDPGGVLEIFQARPASRVEYKGKQGKSTGKVRESKGKVRVKSEHEQGTLRKQR